MSRPITWVDSPSTSTPLSAANLNTATQRLVFNVKDYGAVGNGSTDDTTAVANALSAAGTAGGGTVAFPIGTYSISSALTVPHAVILKGACRTATTLRKSAGGFPLLRYWGSAAGFANHIGYGGARDIRLNGNGFTGTLLDLVYCNNMSFYNVHMLGANDIALDTVEVYDSTFVDIAAENCGSTTLPAVRVGASRAASGFGSSTDSTNQLHFYSLLVEGWKAGAILVDPGTGGNLVHSIYFKDLKLESSNLRGAALKISNTVRNVSVDGAYVYMGNFDAGFSTAQDALSVFGDRGMAIRNVYIANGAGVATIANGLHLWNSGTAVDTIISDYGTAPTNAHVFIEGGNDYSLGYMQSNTGTFVSGTLTTSKVLSPPVRAVAGVVSDASFTNAPPVGTMAVDTTNNKIYVRTGAATWKSVTVA